MCCARVLEDETFLCDDECCGQPACCGCSCEACADASPECRPFWPKVDVCDAGRRCCDGALEELIRRHPKADDDKEDVEERPERCDVAGRAEG